jgi:hypothetical protein
MKTYERKIRRGISRRLITLSRSVFFNPSLPVSQKPYKHWSKCNVHHSVLNLWLL